MKTYVGQALFLSASFVVAAAAAADEEQMEICLEAQQKLAEKIVLQETFRNMLDAYNATCETDNLCKVEISEDTLYQLKNMDPNHGEIPAIIGSADINFGKNFHENAAFTDYHAACADEGGVLECMDAHIVLNGEAGALFMKDEEGIQTDVDVKVIQFPACFPKECDGIDVTALFESALKLAFLKAPNVTEDLTPESEALVQSLSIDQVCALSGLETCTIKAKANVCSMDQSPGTSVTVGRFVGALAMTVGAFIALF
jgi:hypothetical protein